MINTSGKEKGREIKKVERLQQRHATEELLALGHLRGGRLRQDATERHSDIDERRHKKRR